MPYCLCHSTLTHTQAKDGLIDEVKEFIEEPSKDEASDIVYSLNRMIGSFVGKPYVKIFPGDKLHIQKIEKRMDDYGCIRSKRHLIFGLCPSKFEKDKAYINVSFSIIVGAINLTEDSIYGVGLKMKGIKSGIYELEGSFNIIPVNI